VLNNCFEEKNMSDDFVKKEFSEEEVAWHNKEEALLEEMGLTRQDTDQLRKQMFKAEDAVDAKSEEMVKIRQHKNRKDNWQEFLDFKARMGVILSGHDIIRRLRILMPKLRAYDGRVRGTYGLVCPIVRTFEDGFHPGWEYLGWIHSDWNPEYTIDVMDENGILTGEKRQGYRGFLLKNLIKKDGTGAWVLKARGVVKDGTGLPLRLLTEDGVNRVFGDPSGSLTSDGRSQYRRQLWRFRHGLKGDFNLTKWF
jgi:hypothetical protein